MSNVNRTNQDDSPSLSIGEFRTGTGRARQTPGNTYALEEEKKKKNLICETLIMC